MAIDWNQEHPSRESENARSIAPEVGMVWLIMSTTICSLHGVRGQAVINLDASEIRSDARGITLPLFAPCIPKPFENPRS